MSIKGGSLECPACKEEYIKLDRDIGEGELLLLAYFEYEGGRKPKAGGHIACGSCGYNAGLSVVLGYNQMKQEELKDDEDS